MANRTYLLGLNSNLITDDKLDSGVLVEASYLMPLLWFSLFRPEDQLVYENTPLLLGKR
jgi:hypothetical protein